jgi:hypothetical protein
MKPAQRFEPEDFVETNDTGRVAEARVTDGEQLEFFESSDAPNINILT